MIALLVLACGAPPPPPAPAPAAPPPEVPSRVHAWDSAAGDAAVPARLGGPGFTGDGWTTRDEVHAIGVAEAPQGGTLVMQLRDPERTKRAWVVETLLALDPVTGEPVPRLATHWQFSPGGKSWKYRINPTARFSDGSEVTASEVVASATRAGRGAGVTALSKYLVQVKPPKGEGWRAFLSMATAVPIASENGLGSGPYAVERDDPKNGLKLVRRPNWWGEPNPVWDGLYNFAAIRAVPFPDANAAFDALDRGALDWLGIDAPRRWVEDLPAHPAVVRGLIARRAIDVARPQEVVGLAVDALSAPLDDVRLRRALQLLLPRDRIVSTLHLGLTAPVNAYLSTPRPIAYDELAAVQLLESAGWTAMDGAGYRMRDGRRLTLSVTYEDASADRWLGFYKESAQHAGIELDVTLRPSGQPAPPASLTAVTLELPAWADPGAYGAVSERFGTLLAEFDRTQDPVRRAALARDLEGLLDEAVPMVLGWHDPAHRVAFWNKFGMPPWGAGPIDDEARVPVSWWIDPMREAALSAARASLDATLDGGPVAMGFWSQKAPGP